MISFPEQNEKTFAQYFKELKNRGRFEKKFKRKFRKFNPEFFKIATLFTSIIYISSIVLSYPEQNLSLKIEPVSPLVFVDGISNVNQNKNVNLGLISLIRCIK